MSFTVHEERPCPSCGFELQWIVIAPPIPMTFYEWIDERKLGDEPGHVVQECPECGEELPSGDLRVAS